MTCLVRILTTKSVDSSPAILLISPDGSKTLVNCGEGCQRVFLEYGQKLSTVNRVCLTHLSHDSIGGLPGLILTTADIVKAAMGEARAKLEPAEVGNLSNDLPGILLVGPVGTQKFVSSLRHFMRRSAFEVQVQEGEFFESTKDKQKNKSKGTGSERPLHVQSLVLEMDNFNRRLGSSKRPRTEGRRQILSFIFTTAPIQGKFLVERAKALGIPPGPLYGQLKNGKSVNFQSTDGTIKTVSSSEVVEPGSPGLSVAVLCYPTIELFEQLKNSEKLNIFKEGEKDNSLLEIIVHMTERDVFSAVETKVWRNAFGRDVQHIFLETFPASYSTKMFDAGTPFHSAIIGATTRAKISEEIYSCPKMPFTPRRPITEMIDDTKSLYTEAKPLLEYVIIPRSKRGFRNQNMHLKHWDAIQAKADQLLEDSGAVNLAQSILSKEEVTLSNGRNEGKGELIFTGTGSAIPCKHRNVSGIYLRMENGNSILLDVGEGTIGQLIRAKAKENPSDILLGIKAVWLSHPHADHHLGILRLLAERKLLTDEPLMLIAPPNIHSFLEEFQTVDMLVQGSYTFMDCRDISIKAQHNSWSSESLQSHNRKLDQLQADLGITSCTSIPVAHCPHAFAIILDNTSFGRMVYSGDCRPSKPLAYNAFGADLLIHEATFADGMEAEAAIKRHSTVGEALAVAELMKAKAVVLTHFSQRYPKVPPVANAINQNVPIIFAFDFMRLTPPNLVAASKLTPTLRLLYPENEPKDGDDNRISESQEAIAALEIPGLFAQKSLL